MVTPKATLELAGSMMNGTGSAAAGLARQRRRTPSSEALPSRAPTAASASANWSATVRIITLPPYSRARVGPALAPRGASWHLGSKKPPVSASTDQSAPGQATPEGAEAAKQYADRDISAPIAWAPSTIRDAFAVTTPMSICSMTMPPHEPVRMLCSASSMGQVPSCHSPAEPLGPTRPDLAAIGLACGPRRGPSGRRGLAGRGRRPAEAESEATMTARVRPRYWPGGKRGHQKEAGSLYPSLSPHFPDEAATW